MSVSKEHGSKLVTPLYKRMFCANEPHLVMPGLVDFTPLTHHAFEHQAIVAAAAVCGQVKLPRYDPLALVPNATTTCFAQNYFS